MKTLAAAPEVSAEPGTSFWSRLLKDESMQALSDFERLVTGCEIIAALDDLELLNEFAI